MAQCCGRGVTKTAQAQHSQRPGAPPVTTGRVQVRVYSEDEKNREIANRPGYQVTVARFGPTTTLLTFTPRK